MINLSRSRTLSRLSSFKIFNHNTCVDRRCNSSSCGSGSGVISTLLIGDDAASWRLAGFSIEKDNELTFGKLKIKFLGKSNLRGCLGWELGGERSNEGPVRVEVNQAVSSAGNNISHPNGVSSIDHIVMKVNSSAHAEEALGALGINKIRETINTEKKISYSFYRPGGLILEVVAAIPSADGLTNETEKPGSDGLYTNIWGITFVTRDIDHTHQYLKEITKPSWPAVQKNRRITTLDSKGIDISLRVAFITPHVRAVA